MVSAKPRVAIVDDEGPVRIALGRLLRLAEFEIDAFGSGEEFLASLDMRLPACAILDINLPGLSGLDVQARLRAERRQIPVILITASDERDLENAARGAGCVGLLRKPFAGDRLLDMVRTALDNGGREAAP